MALPKIGLQAVLEGYNPFAKALDTVNKKMAESAKQAKETAKAASPLSSVLDKAGVSFDSVKAKISQFTGINAKAIDGVFQITQAFGPMAIAAGAAVVAVAALGAGFLALGNRGAPLVGLGESFDRLTASVGMSSQALLVDLRQASAGTVSDFDLIRRANMALVGAQGEFGKAFGKNLPKLLEAARAAARATGQDVDFLFQSIVTGIKRASPLLIDNTGIVLKVGAANEAMAKSLGKSVEQLTAEEKQIAVLNATLESGQKLIDSLGGAAETNAEKMARSNAIITNTFDALALAMQPAFATVLDIVNRVLSGFQSLVTGIAPILGSIASIITDVLGGAINSILDIISPIASAIGSFLPYIALVFQGIANVVSGVVNFIGGIIQKIVEIVQWVAKNVFGLDFDNMGKNLFEGAAAAFGSFANGIIETANKLIFPVIIGIAKFIADFLIGFSPPKKGPLSQIDKGGENVMLAWLDGIAGVSLDPVADVANQVSLMLGDIGKASLPMVDARLKELDQALLPFQNRLAIVKSQFDAIAAPAQAALEAIDRQMQKAQEALMGGDVAAADTIRRLDAAREAIQGQLDAQQAVVDQQQIQLGLAQASQAQERALLEIRRAQIIVTKKVADSKGGSAGVPREPKTPGGSGAAPIEAPGGAVGGGFVTPDVSVVDLIGGQAAVDEAAKGLQEAFLGEIDTSNLITLGENTLALQEQFDRIGSVDLGSKLKDKFKGLTDIFDPNVEGSVANVVSRFFNPDPSVAGSFASFTNSLQNIDLSAVGAAVGEKVKAVFDFFTSEEEGSLKANLAIITGDASVEGSVANFFANMPQRISDGLGDLLTKLRTDVFDPVTAFLSGTEPGTFGGIINDVVTFFTDLPQRISDALASLGATLQSGIVVPVVEMFNAMIGVVETGLKNLLQNALDFAGGFVGALGVFAPPELAEAINTLKGTVSSLAIPRIPVPSISVPKAAKGGLFGPGAIDVGEHGRERIFAADRIGILPAELTRVLESLSSIIAQPSPMFVPGGDTYNNSSSNFTFNGVQSDNDARRRFNSLRAGMR